MSREESNLLWWFMDSYKSYEEQNQELIYEM